MAAATACQTAGCDSAGTVLQGPASLSGSI